MRFLPVDGVTNESWVADWARSADGRAAITGRRARNLNPIVLADGNERRIVPAWWWLWGDGTGGPLPYSAFNSREDRLLHSWLAPLQRRAILPATWYVEKGVRFELPRAEPFGAEPFGIAAITLTVVLEGGERLVTYSMVTRSAVGAAAEASDRMPLVLPRSEHDAWLDPRRSGDAALVARVRAASEGVSHAFAVAPLNRAA